MVFLNKQVLPLELDGAASLFTCVKKIIASSSAIYNLITVLHVKKSPYEKQKKIAR